MCGFTVRLDLPGGMTHSLSDFHRGDLIALESICVMNDSIREDYPFEIPNDLMYLNDVETLGWRT
jgi:hypothetical protein